MDQGGAAAPRGIIGPWEAARAFDAEGVMGQGLHELQKPPLGA